MYCKKKVNKNNEPAAPRMVYLFAQDSLFVGYDFQIPALYLRKPTKAKSIVSLNNLSKHLTFGYTWHRFLHLHKISEKLFINS